MGLKNKQGELGCHARCGRPKILTQAAIKIIKKAKYRRGFGLRQIEKSLKTGGLKGNKEAIRNYVKVELKWRCWKRRKAPLLTDAHRKNGCYSRGSIDIENSKTGVMFYLVTNRRIMCSMFQTHAMTPFGVRKKKMTQDWTLLERCRNVVSSLTTPLAFSSRMVCSGVQRLLDARGQRGS